MPDREPYQNPIELLQGTLDLLVLQTLTWGPQHGYGIASAIRAGSRDALQVDTGSLHPALHPLAPRPPARAPPQAPPGALALESPPRGDGRHPRRGRAAERGMKLPFRPFGRRRRERGREQEADARAQRGGDAST